MGTAKGVFGKILIAVFSLFVALPSLQAQEKSGDLDSYKWRVTALWWYSQPTGGFTASSDQVSFDLSRDFHFGSYSTFSGGFDWHFKRKHHFLFTASPVYSSRSSTLTRDITFRGVTYTLGKEVSVQFNSLAFAPGYQWDFIRRRQGYVALATSFNLLDSTGSITGTGSINGVSATRKSSGSVLAPIPVLGSTTRWYLIRNSPRLSLEGTFQGMYLFGYGSFYSANGKAQVKSSPTSESHRRLSNGHPAQSENGLWSHGRVELDAKGTGGGDRSVLVIDAHAKALRPGFGISSPKKKELV